MKKMVTAMAMVLGLLAFIMVVSASAQECVCAGCGYKCGTGHAANCPYKPKLMPDFREVVCQHEDDLLLVLEPTRTILLARMPDADCVQVCGQDLRKCSRGAVSERINCLNKCKTPSCDSNCWTEYNAGETMCLDNNKYCMACCRKIGEPVCLYHQ